MSSLEFDDTDGHNCLAKCTHRMNHPRFWDQLCWWLTVRFSAPWLLLCKLTGLWWDSWDATGARCWAQPTAHGQCYRSPWHPEAGLLQTSGTHPPDFHLTLGRACPSSGQAGSARELISLETVLRWISSRVTSSLTFRTVPVLTLEVLRNLSVPNILTWVHILHRPPDFPKWPLQPVS